MAAAIEPRQRIGRICLGDMLHRAARRFGAYWGAATLANELAVMSDDGRLPVTSTGKIQKFELRQSHLRHFEKEEE